MYAEVIAIGDELTSGQRLDTNSCWLSKQLGELGVKTIRHTTVGDDLTGNVEALRLAVKRADIVVCTGGLGPTLDDLTRQAMADAFDRPLQLDHGSLENIQQMFSFRNREMPERNRIQAMFPAGSLVIPNPHGTAPGIDLSVQVDGRLSRIFSLPGVPAEMKQMWSETVVPRIEDILGMDSGSLRYHEIKVFGIGESDVEVKLPDLIERTREPTVGITVSRATITLRIAGRAKSEIDFQTLIQPTVEEIQAALGNLVFGQGSDELEHVVVRQLLRQGKKMCCVEVGAASWIGDWMLAAQAEEGTEYLGGLAFPSLAIASGWLASEFEIGNQSHVDDDAIWEAIAKQAKLRFECDVALVVGVYPTRSQMEQAVSPFHPVFALAIDDSVQVVRRTMGGHPDVLGPRIAKTGLDLVRQSIA